MASTVGGAFATSGTDDEWMQNSIQTVEGGDVRVVGEASGADFSTIQEAHDDLPEGGTDRREGSGGIIVDGTYDSSQEDFPVRIEKYVDIRGTSLTRSRVHTTDPSVDLFHIVNPNDVNFFQRINMSNLYLRGGRHGIVVDGLTLFNGRNLIMRDMAGDGLRTVNEESSGGLHAGYLENVYAWACGGYGIDLNPNTLPHGWVLSRCSATRCEVGIRMGGYAGTILGGAYQNNRDYGVHLESAGAMGVHNAYIELNGTQQTNPRDVLLGINALGAKLHNCYIHGGRLDDGAETHAAIESGNNNYCEVDHCTFRGYDRVSDTGLFDLSNNSDNFEVNLGTHQYIGDRPPFFQTEPSTYLNNGVLFSDEIDEVSGRYAGQQGFSEGQYYSWDGDEWVEFGEVVGDDDDELDRATKELIDTYIDDNRSTPIDYEADIGSIYDTYAIEANFSPQTGTVPVYMRVGNIEDDVYEYRSFEGTEITTTSGESEWTLAVLTAGGRGGAVRLAGQVAIRHDPTAPHNRNTISSSFNLSTVSDDEVMVNGNIAQAVNLARALRIWTEQNMTARINLYGIDLE
ncbi:hypothetical protein [Natronorarus salvus]|uniref:hypothetical protein n=1 Tax=Natronorarus salvus TaxID=3117733 RepID=UPI002F260B37